jgi:hypothetical protein
MSYTQILYHIVLRTKRGKRPIAQDNISSLYKYVWGIIKNKKGTLYRIKGILNSFRSTPPVASLHWGLFIFKTFGLPLTI